MNLRTFLPLLALAWGLLGGSQAWGYVSGKTQPHSHATTAAGGALGAVSISSANISGDRFSVGGSSFIVQGSTVHAAGPYFEVGGSTFVINGGSVSVGGSHFFVGSSTLAVVSGAVGIRTTNPILALDVNGSALVRSTFSTSGDVALSTVAWTRNGQLFINGPLGASLTSESTVTIRGAGDVIGITIKRTNATATSGAIRFVGSDDAEDVEFRAEADAAILRGGGANRFSANTGGAQTIASQLTVEGGTITEKAAGQVNLGLTRTNSADALGSVEFKGSDEVVEARFSYALNRAGTLALEVGGADKIRADSDEFSTTVPPTFLSSVTINGQTSSDGTLLLGGSAPTTNSTGKLQFQNSSTQINWQLSTNNTQSGALEFARTTAGGGVTYESTPSMLLSNSGNLGLGTGSPSGKLDVRGGMYVSSSVVAQTIDGSAITASSGCTKAVMAWSRSGSGVSTGTLVALRVTADGHNGFLIFTTTTTANVVGPLGVVAHSSAPANAFSPVCVEGLTRVKCDNALTVGNCAATGTTATNGGGIANHLGAISFSCGGRIMEAQSSGGVGWCTLMLGGSGGGP